jgi:hypothetical protein
MTKPKLMAVATAVVMAGISNAIIYTLGFVVLLIFQFLTKDAGGATLASASSALIITLMFTLLLSTIITFILAFPIALICRAFGFMGSKAFLIAPAIGAAFACWVASKLDVETTTYVAIVAFAYIAAGIMWLALAKGEGAVTPAVGQPAM